MPDLPLVADAVDGTVAGNLASHLSVTGEPEDRQEAEMWLRATMAHRASTVACAELAFFLSHRPQQKIGFEDEDPYAEARYLAHRALTGDNDQPVAWEALGNCDCGEGKWGKAIVNFEKAMLHSTRPKHVRQKIEFCRERLDNEERR